MKTILSILLAFFFTALGTEAVAQISDINAAINKVLSEQAVQNRLEDLTMQVRADSTPESAARWLQTEMAKWEPIIRDAGIKAD